MPIKLLGRYQITKAGLKALHREKPCDTPLSYSRHSARHWLMELLDDILDGGPEIPLRFWEGFDPSAPPNALRQAAMDLRLRGFIEPFRPHGL